MVSWLIEHGADANAKSPFKVDATLVRKLQLKRPNMEKIDTEEINSLGNTALLVAVSSSSAPSVKVLLGEGANIHASNSLGEHALHLAAAARSQEIVAMLLSYGASLDVFDKFLRTPLQVAVEMGSLNMTRIMLEYNAEPRTRDLSGWSPLEYAVLQRNFEMTRLLIQYGALFSKKVSPTFLHLKEAMDRYHKHDIEISDDTLEEIEALHQLHRRAVNNQPLSQQALNGFELNNIVDNNTTAFRVERPPNDHQPASILDEKFQTYNSWSTAPGKQSKNEVEEQTSVSAHEHPDGRGETPLNMEESIIPLTAQKL